MNDDNKHLGLTTAQWRQLYEDGDWKAVFMQAAVEVSTCIHAHPADRDNAIGLVVSLIRHGVLKETDWPGERTISQAIRDNQLALVRGTSIATDEAKRKQCADRVVGMRILGEMALSFQDQQVIVGMPAALQQLLGGAPTKAGDN